MRIFANPQQKYLQPWHKLKI